MAASSRLIESISADDDAHFNYYLSEVKDAQELNVTHQIYTPLGLACAFDRWKFVHALLRKGADVNVRTGALQQYPIHFAAKNDSKGVKCTEFLYAFGADLNSQDAERNTALHHACAMENVLLFDFLMQNGANINLANKDDETPLLRAIRSQNQYMIKRLINEGCDLNYPNGEPLDRLIRASPPMPVCVDLIIQRGADLDKKPYLSTAAACNNIDLMNLLKDHGVNINEASGTFNFTALHSACESERASLEVVELLLDWGADVHIKSNSFDTPLHVACARRNLKKILALFEYNPDVTSRNSRQCAPLTLLFMTRFSKTDNSLDDFFKIFQVLIATGAHISARDIEICEKVLPKTLKGRKSEQEISAFIETVKHCAYQPPKLLNLCRFKVRNCLKPKVCDKIPLLPLPLSIRNFLLFKDIV